MERNLEKLSGTPIFCIIVLGDLQFLFFMISGSLFLDSKRELSIKKIYGHNILHLGIAFLFWSTFNAVLDLFQNVWIEKEISFEALETFVKAVALGPTIYWFLFVLIALYMVTPFLRCIAADKKLTEYFLVLWMIFTMFSSFTNQ